MTTWRGRSISDLNEPELRRALDEALTLLESRIAETAPSALFTMGLGVAIGVTLAIIGFTLGAHAA